MCTGVCLVFLMPQIALHFDWGVEDILNLRKSLKLLKAHSLSLKIQVNQIKTDNE